MLSTATNPVAARLLSVPEGEVSAFMAKRGFAPVQPGIYSVVGTAWRRWTLSDIAEARGRPVSAREVSEIEKELEPRREAERARKKTSRDFKAA